MLLLPCIQVLYSNIYIAPLSSHGPTEHALFKGIMRQTCDIYIHFHNFFSVSVIFIIRMFFCKLFFICWLFNMYRILLLSVLLVEQQSLVFLHFMLLPQEMERIINIYPMLNSFFIQETHKNALCGIPSTSAARGDNLKCRPFRNKLFTPSEKMSNKTLT